MVPNRIYAGLARSQPLTWLNVIYNNKIYINLQNLDNNWTKHTPWRRNAQPHKSNKNQDTP